MKILALISSALLLSFVITFATGEEADKLHPAKSYDLNLVGQVLLPGGFSRRGLEIHATVTSLSGESVDKWLLFNEQGRFYHAFRGRLDSVVVTAGVGFEVFQLDPETLRESNKSAQIDVGKIDLRARLIRHKLIIQSKGGEEAGDIRVAMWSGPPPVGPSGGQVSLGSKQFPSIALGHKQEWLVPVGAKSIYFLVERPADSNQKNGWHSGEQQLFGPFTSANIPENLLLD